MGNLERIQYMDFAARERGGFTLPELARRFEVSERQLRRDLAYLRDRLDAPLVWDPVSRRYRYETEYRALEFADERALLFLVFARAAAESLAFVPFAETEALKYLRDLVPERLRGLEEKVRYELPELERADDEALALLLGAIRDRRGVEFSYRDARGRESERAAVPRRLVNYAGTWYCVAYDRGKAELRTFKLTRATRLVLGPAAGDAGPPEEEVDSFLRSSYGMFKGEPRLEAKVRFYGRAREIVRSELWHPDQARVDGSDSRKGPFIELSLPLSRWDEILGRVLRFGAEAEPVGPPELRELWKGEIRRMAEEINNT